MSMEKLTIQEEFDLRERRIKLMYPILYAAAVIWVALIVLLGNGTINEDTIPIFCSIMTVDTLTILEIVKYVFSEFRCLKIKEEVSDNLKIGTDKLYDNVWIMFVINSVLSFLFLVIHLEHKDFLTIQRFTVLFIYSYIIFVISFFLGIKFIKEKIEKVIQKHQKLKLITAFITALESSQMIIVPIIVYSLYVLFCQVVMQNA